MGTFPNSIFIWKLYGFCVEINYFPYMDLVQFIQTWILTKYHFGFLRYQTWFSQNVCRTLVIGNLQNHIWILW